MLLFEFTVAGPPVSQQTRKPENLRAWRRRVRTAARRRWPNGQAPFKDQLRMTIVYYHDRPSIRLDNDNMVKPVRDALIGLVYDDDVQITDDVIRKTCFDHPIRARGISIVLAHAFSRGKEFLHVQVHDAPDHAGVI